MSDEQTELSFDVVVVGGGVIGCAIARQLAISKPTRSIALLEKEQTLAYHTSGRNSGVIHSGFNQTPGTLKAKFCVEGNSILRAFCGTKGVRFEKCGTLVVSQRSEDQRVIRELERRGRLNGVPGVGIIDRVELSRLEPNVAGAEALYSPTGSIVDSRGLVYAIAREAEEHSAEIITGAEVISLREAGGEVIVSTTKGELACKLLVNCAGLHADRIARMLDLSRRYKIIPLKGQYYRLRREKSGLIRSMVYPPPNLEFPFLGVHFTKRVNGDVILGPNATLVGGREGYSFGDYDPLEILEMVSFPGFLRASLNPKFVKLILGELYTSARRSRFMKLARALVPTVGKDDFTKDTAGIRAQLLSDRGELLDDFLIEWGEHSIHVLNAISPGMTCSIPFAGYVVQQAEDRGYL